MAQYKIYYEVGKGPASDEPDTYVVEAAMYKREGDTYNFYENRAEDTIGRTIPDGAIVFTARAAVVNTIEQLDR